MLRVSSDLSEKEVQPLWVGRRSSCAGLRQLNLGAVALLLAFGGCQSAEKPEVPQGRITIKRLAILYGQFAGGRPPRDEEEFRKFVEKNKSRVPVAVDTQEDLFISPRDGKPYVILYGSEAQKHQQSGLAIYEQEGVNGLRQVAFTIGMVEEVDDAWLQEILSGNSR